MKRPTLEQYAQRYTAYLRLVGSDKATSHFLDLSAEQLLLFLALEWSTGRKVTVVQAMRESPGMSTTTAHRRLKILRKHGFITLETNEEDNRIKYIVATTLTQRYFAQMGKHLTQASA